MTIEEEIARIVDAEFDDYAPRYSEAGECVGSNVAAALMPLVKRAQAEALREAADELSVRMSGEDPMARLATSISVGGLRNRADRIEQEGAGA